MSRAQIQADLDCAIAFANTLFVFGSSHARLQPRLMVVADGCGHVARVPVIGFNTFSCRDDVPLDPAQAAAEGFVAALSLCDLLALRIYDSEMRITFETDQGVIVGGSLTTTLAPFAATEDGQSTLSRLEIAARLGMVEGRLVDVLKRRHSPVPAEPLNYAIDIAGRSHSGFVVEGWIANARAGNLSFLSADGLVYVPNSEVIFKARPDVSEHLRSQKQPVLTEDHGVLLNFPHTIGSTDGFFVLRQTGDTLTPIARIKLTFADNRDRLIELVSYAVGGGRLPRPVQAKKFYVPFFAEPQAAEEFSVNWIKRKEATTSIVIPLFRDYRFIFSLLTMQLRFPPHVEWIFVSDDPVLHQVLTRILERRSNALKGSAALVTNRFNYGFGASNNIGASVARGKTLLFMNSDIWVDSAQPLEEAERKLQADTHQLIGFRLLYEDGSIQHDGMAFRPSPLVHNLLLAEHPRKGTPADDDVGRIVTVPAVTGAMMMISKDVFMRVGQFDRAYIKGDFEDADLCMKVRAHGGQIGLYKTNDIYHLERQSIRLMADETGRLALTYLNCITFNERWGKILAQRPAPSGQAKTSSAAASAERGETQRKRVRAV